MQEKSNQTNTYSGEDAAALSVLALTRLTFAVFEVNFECTCDDDVLKKFVETFQINPQVIGDMHKSYSTAFAAGGEQVRSLLPDNLYAIYDSWKNISDQDLYDAVDELLGFVWLPDLEQTWDSCRKELAGENDFAEGKISSEISDRIANYLSRQRGYTVDDIASTAMHITSNRNKQKSIISFAVLPKLKHVLPFLFAVGRYNDAAHMVERDLIEALPNTVDRSKLNEQSVFDCIRSKEFDEAHLIKILCKHFGNEYTSLRFVKAIRDQSWSGFKKSIFRSKKDVLNSVCLNKLNFENVKTGYIENLIEYFIDTGDELPELSGVSSSSTQHHATISPDLDRNVIFVGAPGTGKSFAAQSYAGKAHIERVVFYKDYQNADFVGYSQPQADPKFGAKYEFETGPFLRALKQAFDSPNEPVVLLIEEINRGDAPAIFGEVFQLLDRDHTGESEYRVGVASSVMKELSSVPALAAENKIWLPSNLFIVATMNSSDQGVAPLDGAFTRRFGKRYVPINFDAHNSNPDFTDAKINLSFDAVSWSVFASAVNEVLLDANFPEDKLLGPFFLSPSELAKPDLDASIVQKVCFYLWEEILRYDDKSLLFDDSVRSFSDLQKKYNLRQMVFSEAVREQIVSQSRTEETDLNEDISSSAD